MYAQSLFAISVRGLGSAPTTAPSASSGVTGRMNAAPPPRRLLPPAFFAAFFGAFFFATFFVAFFFAPLGAFFAAFFLAIGFLSFLGALTRRRVHEHSAICVRHR